MEAQNLPREKPIFEYGQLKAVNVITMWKTIYIIYIFKLYGSHSNCQIVRFSTPIAVTETICLTLTIQSQRKRTA